MSILCRFGSLDGPKESPGACRFLPLILSVGLEPLPRSIDYEGERPLGNGKIDKITADKLYIVFQCRVQGAGASRRQQLELS